MRRLSIRHGEAPGASHKSCFRPERFNSQVGKVELPHFFAFALVSLAIAFQRGLPAGGDLCPRVEGQFWRVPVTRHEALQVVLVPSLNLTAHYLLDSTLGRSFGSLSNDSGREKEYHSR